MKQHGPHKQQGQGGGGQAAFRFRNYELMRRIDVGGMGEVYLARQRTAFDREVAIKIIRSDLMHDMTVRKRFRREAEVNAHIKHGHILSLVEFGEEEGRLFFVTPYIAGGTLSRRLLSGPLSLAEIHQLFKALVEAIGYIHRRGVVHRDLKPSNILLDQEGESGDIYIYLIDFGIASIQGQAAEPPLTTAGTELGTVAYMAPERLSGIAAPSNDIYSLGVILYQMLTGQLPDKEPRIAVPQPLKYVVELCMAPPGRRFNSADEVLEAFEYAYQYLQASSSPPQAPPARPPAEEDITPRRVSALGSSEKTAPFERPAGEEVKKPQRFEAAAPGARLARTSGFAGHDYEAPTTSVDVSSGGANGARRPRARSRGTNPFFAIVTLLIVVVLLVMAGLFYVEFQAATLISASVNFAPQVRPISQVFSIEGSQSRTSVDVSGRTIPVKTSAPASQTGSQTGVTSRQCILFICQQVVTQNDVGNISAQLKQRLDGQIAVRVNQQLESQQGVTVGSIAFTTTSTTYEPPVGSESKSVTVKMSEQGQVAYFLRHDAQQLARALLQQQVQSLGTHFALVNSLTQVGEPGVVSIDGSTGLVLIKVAAAGIGEYQFPAAELHAMRAGVKGMKVGAAIAYIQHEQGVDAQTVAIHVSGGDSLPGDLAHIKIVSVNPASFPPLQLTPVAGSATPTQ